MCECEAAANLEGWSAGSCASGPSGWCPRTPEHRWRGRRLSAWAPGGPASSAGPLRSEPVLAGTGASPAVQMSSQQRGSAPGSSSCPSCCQRWVFLESSSVDVRRCRAICRPSEEQRNLYPQLCDVTRLFKVISHKHTLGTAGSELRSDIVSQEILWKEKSCLFTKNTSVPLTAETARDVSECLDCTDSTASFWRPAN